MDILFVTGALAPYVSGPTAEASAALGKALRAVGHKVTVIAPLVRGIDPTARSLARRLSKVDVAHAGGRVACEVYDGRTAGGLDVIFIGQEQTFRGAASLDAGGAALFGAAVVAIAKARTPAFDVLHGEGVAGAGAILAEAADDALTIPTLLAVRDGVEPGTDDLVRRAIADADGIVVPSPSLAVEIGRGGSTHPLGDALGAAAPKLSGILDGVDASTWNPMTDPQLVARFDPFDRAGKDRCRNDFQKRLDLPVRADVPLLVAIASPDPHAGFDLLAKVGVQVLRNDCELAVLFEGPEDHALLVVLRELAERFSDRCAVRVADAETVHRAIAAADLVLAPPREPCGSSVHLVAHRYGALPIVRRTGGLADAVVDCDAALETGDGFVFDAANEDELLATIRRALAGFAQAEAFEGRRRHAMRIDHSWERAARLYERIYGRLTAG